MELLDEVLDEFCVRLEVHFSLIRKHHHSEDASEQHRDLTEMLFNQVRNPRSFHGVCCLTLFVAQLEEV